MRELPHAADLRRGRFSQPGAAYHITKCRAAECHVPLTEGVFAQTIIDSIKWHKSRGYAHLLGFVVMPDHLHWLFVLGGSRSLKEVMNGFGSFTSHALRPYCRPLGVRVWQAEYYERCLRRAERTWKTIEYAHNNPVRKGLCSHPEEWPWSTANPAYRGWIEEEYLL